MCYCTKRHCEEVSCIFQNLADIRGFFEKGAYWPYSNYYGNLFIRRLPSMSFKIVMIKHACVLDLLIKTTGRDSDGLKKAILCSENEIIKLVVFHFIKKKKNCQNNNEMKAVHFAIFIIVSLFVLEYAEGNIHRAVHTRRRPKQESGFLTRFYTKLKKSWLAIPASFLVGCTGIFPLLVIPVQSGKSLKEGGK